MNHNIKKKKGNHSTAHSDRAPLNNRRPQTDRKKGSGIKKLSYSIPTVLLTDAKDGYFGFCQSLNPVPSLPRRIPVTHPSTPWPTYHHPWAPPCNFRSGKYPLRHLLGRGGKSNSCRPSPCEAQTITLRGSSSRRLSRRPGKSFGGPYVRDHTCPGKAALLPGLYWLRRELKNSPRRR